MTYRPTTTTPTDTRIPHTRTPLEMTKLWSFAGLLLALAVLALVLGAAGWASTSEPVAGFAGLVVALVAGVPGAILAVYTRLEHGQAYGRKQTPANTAPPPIYVTSRMDVGGKTVDRDPTPVDFGVNPPELDAALRYLRNGGKTSRAEMCKVLGISQGQWARLMDGLQTAGIVRNNGRAGIDIIGGIEAMLADLEAQLGRW